MRFQIVDDDGQVIEIVPEMRFLLRLPKQRPGEHTIWVIAPGKPSREALTVFECDDSPIGIDYDAIEHLISGIIRLSGFNCVDNRWSGIREDQEADLPDKVVRSWVVRE
jgi:hypothetical protein